MSKVKLAIRVRPFTEKELRGEKHCIPVVTVLDEKTVTITNIKVSLTGAGDSRERLRRYQADYVFDSLCARGSQTYASQETVFETFGRQVLESISNGLSACVLAYGQSATGKTYTMMGTESNPGLIPRLCLALAELGPIDLSVSFYEIYNERVHDLLASEVLPCNSLPRRTGNIRKDLRVREHPTRGPYVQNLRQVSVHDVESLLSIVSEGKRQRRSAATRRNSNSSRSHALLEITTPRAVLRLVDLAGSEKAGREVTGACRQKEGANINKSLVALSNVISALVSDAGRGRFVPYRNSALTWLLKDCFTGDANTFIIATISPSVSCFNETASTLRWVARARHLPPKLNNNKSSATKGVQHQYNKLIDELTKHYIYYVPATGKISFDDRHWSLNSTSLPNKSKIGNIMSFSKSKTDQIDSGASVANDYLVTISKDEISNEINKEIDTLIRPPVLGRARSGSDFEITVPIQHKRKYGSQEVLSSDRTMNYQINRNSLSELGQSLSEEMLDQTNKNLKNTSASILYDNDQRAQIVASVTERLYSKLKKREETTSKIETISDKKNVQPLNELKICTNARQRLMEISQKALRTKRRIGIPAYTQTKKTSVRLKDKCIDVQSDLLSFRFEELCNTHISLKRDVGTETAPLTPRHKEVGVGSDSALLMLKSTKTITDDIKVYKESGTMTAKKKENEKYTQTLAIRKNRKRSVLSKYLKKIDNNARPSSVININISPVYYDSQSQHSDDSEADTKQRTHFTPTVLTTYNKLESDCEKNKKYLQFRNQETSTTEDSTSLEINIESVKSPTSDDSEISLPNNIIDSHNINGKKCFTLEGKTNTSAYNTNNLPKKGKNCGDHEPSSEKFCFDLNREQHFNKDDPYFASLSSDENKDYFLNKKLSFKETYKAANTTSQGRNYAKNENIFKTTKAKLYKEFLGVETEEDADEHYSGCSLSTQKGICSLRYGRDDDNRPENIVEPCNSLNDVERTMKLSCDKIELAVHKYENYLRISKERPLGRSTDNQSDIKSPTEYLRHLIRARKDFIKMDHNFDKSD